MSTLDHNAISMLLRECILGYTKIQKIIVSRFNSIESKIDKIESNQEKLRIKLNNFIDKINIDKNIDNNIALPILDNEINNLFEEIESLRIKNEKEQVNKIIKLNQEEQNNLEHTNNQQTQEQLNNSEHNNIEFEQLSDQPIILNQLDNTNSLDNMIFGNSFFDDFNENVSISIT